MIHSHRFAAFAALIGVALFAASAFAAPTVVTGKVSHVTLYRGQALVTRTLPIEGEQGNLEVIVTDLPEQILPGSTFAEGDEGIEVRAVQYRNRAVGEEPREEVRALD